MKMMICDIAETCDCEWECPERDKHEENKDCKKDLGNPYTICLLHPESKCIPYVDPVLKRIQERFNAWVKATKDESGMLAVSASVLKRIIQEELEK